MLKDNHSEYQDATTLLQASATQHWYHHATVTVVYLHLHQSATALANQDAQLLRFGFNGDAVDVWKSRS